MPATSLWYPAPAHTMPAPTLAILTPDSLLLGIPMDMDAAQQLYTDNLHNAGRGGHFTGCFGIQVHKCSPCPCPSSTPTWALIVATTPAFPTPYQPTHLHQNDNGLTPQEWINVQQCQLRDSRTVLIQFDLKDGNAPKDFSAAGSSALCNHLNKLLDCTNLKTATTHQVKDGEVDYIMLTTCAIGLKTLGAGAYLAKFDTADAAHRFCEYTSTEWHFFKDLFGKNMQVVEKSFNLII
ncbi:hypothetical protein E4T56_gene1233 [Termitomyces sp. T112]|nr:hypothetical protein E4T56_gene1233 [Termitomyces sp. T112]